MHPSVRRQYFRISILSASLRHHKDDIAVAAMVADMEVHMVADMEVDKVAYKVADMVANLVRELVTGVG